MLTGSIARKSVAFSFPFPAILVGLICWLSLVAVTGVALWREREQAIKEGMRSAEATTALMEQHTATTFRAVHLTLEDTARRLEAGQPAHDAGMRAVMREQRRNMPYVRAVYVIDPDGYVSHDTDYPSTSRVSLADRAYFKAHKENALLETSVSAPLESRSGAGMFIAVSRRVKGAQFRGIVVAAIPLSYFSALYQKISLGEGQRLYLFHADGTKLVQFPPDDATIGRSFKEYPLFAKHLPRAKEGTLVTNGGPLYYQRIFRYQALDNEPLVVALAYDERVVLASWWRMFSAAAVALFALTLLIGAVVFQFMRDQQLRQRVRERAMQGEKLEALGRFTSGITHDFANVLGIIGSSLELISLRLRSADDMTREAVDVGRRAVHNGAAMTHELMAFARKRDLQLVRTNLNESLSSYLPLLQQAAGPRIRINLSLAAELEPCMVDGTQLETALINLVVNARDALGGSGTIEISTSDIRRRATRGWGFDKNLYATCLTVSDKGAGMSDEVRQRALEPFYTTKGDHGTGLGLPQVYGLARQLGGDLSIDSAPGKGTSVHLFFPAAPPA